MLGRIWGPLRRIRTTQQGQTLVFLLIALPVFLALLALVLDGGYALAQRRQMQNAADAAALAGARQLALGAGYDAIDETIHQLASENQADEVEWSLLPGEDGVQVAARHTFDTFFGGIVGIPSMTAHAQATARVAPLGRAGNLLPMIVQEQDFEFGQVYELWTNQQEMPGNFGWLDWNGPPVSNAELASNIANPSNSGYWSVGDWVPAGPGIKNSSPVRNALNTWIGRPVTIPFYDTHEGVGAQARYHISGFGQFILTGYNFRGSQKWVRGYFVRWLAVGPPGGSDHGLRTVYLAD
ncbi:MAG TPA: hypothetical protein EYP04_12110 [Anaerolineae bacterium]|nr:hypothetical protein [Anaerolineae bacterium]HIQ04372.1 hypothetical protein [Anaerolineae bacterium]